MSAVGTETMAFALRLKPGYAEEYKRRHDALWPEMREMLVGSGILHYEIYLEEQSGYLFGHILRRRDHRMDDNFDHPVMARWRRHMADILEYEGDRPLRWPLRCMFVLDAGDQG